MATAKNTAAAESIAAPQGAVGEDCSHITLWSAAAAGDHLWSQAINTDPDALALGQRLSIAAEAIVITQNPGPGETAKMAVRANQGRVAGGVWVQFHSGAPGAAGTDNIIAGLDRVQIAAAGWTHAE